MFILNSLEATAQVVTKKNQNIFYYLQLNQSHIAAANIGIHYLFAKRYNAIIKSYKTHTIVMAFQYDIFIFYNSLYAKPTTIPNAFKFVV